jgi:hypothetical protein
MMASSKTLTLSEVEGRTIDVQAKMLLNRGA